MSAAEDQRLCRRFDTDQQDIPGGFLRSKGINRFLVILAGSERSHRRFARRHDCDVTDALGGCIVEQVFVLVNFDVVGKRAVGRSHVRPALAQQRIYIIFHLDGIVVVFTLIGNHQFTVLEFEVERLVGGRLDGGAAQQAEVERHGVDLHLGFVADRDELTFDHRVGVADLGPNNRLEDLFGRCRHRIGHLFHAVVQYDRIRSR